MIVVQGSGRVPVHETEWVIAALRWYLPACRAEKGCLLYAVTLDPLDPTLLHLSSRWDSELDYARHMSSEHVAQFYAFLARVTLTEYRAYSYLATDENLLTAES